MENQKNEEKKSDIEYISSVNLNDANLKFSEFPIYNKLSLIYGINGIGKSSWVKKVKAGGLIKEEYNIKIFDEDYIFNNVHIIESSGPKSTGDNEVKRAEIYVGNDIKKGYETLTKYNEKITEIKRKKIESERNFDITLKKLLDDYSITENDITIKKIKKDLTDLLIKHTNPNFNFGLSLELNDWWKNAIKEYYKNINFDSKKVGNFIKEWKYKSVLKQIANDISEKFELIVDKETGKIKLDVDSSVNDYISSNKLLLKFLNKYKEKNIELNLKEKKWVQEGIKIHSENNNCVCLFCLSTSFKNKDFQTMINEKLEIIKQNIETFLKKTSDLIEKLKHYKNQLNKLELTETWDINFESLFSFFNSVKKNVQNIKILISENKNVNIEDINLLEIPIESSLFKKIENMRFNGLEIPTDFFIKFLVEEKDSSFSHIYLINIFDKVLPILEKKYSEKNNEINNILKETSNRILCFYKKYQTLFHINFNLKVEFKPPRTSKMDRSHYLSIKDKNNKDVLKYFSTGERRKLALIMFLSELEYDLDLLKKKNLNSLEKKINFSNEFKKIFLVLDDPIDSSDFFTYLSFKNIVMNQLMKADISKIIILTHNIDYVLTQLTNTDKDTITDIHLFKINKFDNNRNFIEVNYKEELLNNNQLLIKSLSYLNESIENLDANDERSKEKLMFYLYCFYCLIVRNIESKGMDMYFSKYFKKIKMQNEKQLLEALKEELHDEEEFQFIHSLSKSLKKCKINNDIWKKLLNLYKNLISSASTIEHNNLIEKLEQIKIEEKINIGNFTKSILESIVQNFKINNSNDNNLKEIHIKSVIKLVGIVNIFKNNFKLGHINRDLASFVRHPQNNLFKPLIALEDIFSSLEVTQVE